MRRYESSYMRRYDRVVALSPEDRSYVSQVLGVAAVESSPLAVETASMLEPQPLGNHALPPALTFLGGYQHPPNVDAVGWLCEEIMPLVRANSPKVRLDIVGRYPEEFVHRHSTDDIRFLGFVADLGPILRNSIFLCPVRLASGMRIKTLDAIVHGAAVVSTTVGSGGLPLEPQREILLADTADEFHRQCRRLIDNDELRVRLTRAAQARIRTQFSPEAVADQRLSILQDVASRRSAADRGA